jgi:acyl carrier protein
MTEQQAWDAIRAAVAEIAPEISAEQLVDGARLKQDLELDSVDFLRVLEQIAQQTGVEIPEDAYNDVSTVNGLVAYVALRG